MAIIKAINSNAKGSGSSKQLEKYLDKDKSLKSGIDCNVDTWSSDFQLTKSIYNKLEGRQYKHFTQSFDKNCKLTPQQVHQTGIDLIKSCKQFQGFQAVVITHLDKEHLHNHIVINSVNLETGKKFQMSNSNLKTLKKNMELSLSKNYNIAPTLPQKSKVKAQGTKIYKVLEKSQKHTYKSFTVDITQGVSSALENSKNKNEFTESLKEKNITANYSNEHNTIMFVDNDLNMVSSKKIKKMFNIDCDNNSLEKVFKENQLINELENPAALNKIMEDHKEFVKIAKEKTRLRELQEQKQRTRERERGGLGIGD